MNLKATVEWALIKEEIEARIELGRTNLEAHSLRDIDTAYIRGSIGAMRELISDVEEDKIGV